MTYDICLLFLTFPCPTFCQNTLQMGQAHIVLACHFKGYRWLGPLRSWNFVAANVNIGGLLEEPCHFAEHVLIWNTTKHWERQIQAHLKSSGILSECILQKCVCVCALVGLWKSSCVSWNCTSGWSLWFILTVSFRLDVCYMCLRTRSANPPTTFAKGTVFHLMRARCDFNLKRLEPCTSLAPCSINSSEVKKGWCAQSLHMRWSLLFFAALSGYLGFSWFQPLVSAGFGFCASRFFLGGWAVNAAFKSCPAKIATSRTWTPKDAERYRVPISLTGW